jgi:hypothetical protein
MKISKLCPLYMANGAALTSLQTGMTHLSWDDMRAAMLGNRAFAGKNRAEQQGLWRTVE